MYSERIQDNRAGEDTEENGSYDLQGYEERYFRRWAWSYGIGLSYQLERIMF